VLLSREILPGETGVLPRRFVWTVAAPRWKLEAAIRTAVSAVSQ